MLSVACYQAYTPQVASDRLKLSCKLANLTVYGVGCSLSWAVVAMHVSHSLGISLTPFSCGELMCKSAFRLAVFLLCDTFFTFTCVHLQPVDPGEVFQDAAGEGDDQVDVDVGVVFNASVTKGEQTLVYASS